MTRNEWAKHWFGEFLEIKNRAPWIANDVSDKAGHLLNEMGGVAGSWRTDYPMCTYYYPVRIGDQMFDLSTPEKVRAHYES